MGCWRYPQLILWAWQSGLDGLPRAGNRPPAGKGRSPRNPPMTALAWRSSAKHRLVLTILHLTLRDHLLLFPAGKLTGQDSNKEIGRASCRERVCQYV